MWVSNDRLSPPEVWEEKAGLCVVVYVCLCTWLCICVCLWLCVYVSVLAGVCVCMCCRECQDVQCLHMRPSPLYLSSYWLREEVVTDGG